MLPAKRLMAAHVALVAAATATLIAAVVSTPLRLATLILGVAPLVGIGRIAYGLYLWHFPIFSTFDNNPRLLARYFHAAPTLILAIKFAAALAAATMSFYCIERPFLRWKGLLSRS